MDTIDIEKIVDELPADSEFHKMLDLLDSFDLTTCIDVTEDKENIEIFIPTADPGNKDITGRIVYRFYLDTPGCEAGKFECCYIE